MLEKGSPILPCNMCANLQALRAKNPQDAPSATAQPSSLATASSSTGNSSSSGSGSSNGSRSGSRAGAASRSGTAATAAAGSEAAAVCAVCGDAQRKEGGGKLQRCSGCTSVRYCSPVCQMQHWKEGGHRKVCKQLQAAAAAAAGLGTGSSSQQ